MKIKTCELIGHALDWVVMGLIFKGYEEMNDPIKPWVKERHDAGEPCGSPSTNRDIGYELLEQKEIGVWPPDEEHPYWTAGTKGVAQAFTGPTPLIAICRCHIASQLGDEVEVPDELVNAT